MEGRASRSPLSFVERPMADVVEWVVAHKD